MTLRDEYLRREIMRDEDRERHAPRPPRPDEWFMDAANVHELARWLDDRCEFADATDAIAFFEKPYRWEPEWHAMRHEKALDERQAREAAS